VIVQRFKDCNIRKYNTNNNKWNNSTLSTIYWLYILRK